MNTTERHPKWVDLFGLDPNYPNHQYPDDADRWLTVSQVAQLIGVKPATFRSYVSRGQAPKPDGHHDLRTPYWKFSTIFEWKNKP